LRTTAKFPQQIFPAALAVNFVNNLDREKTIV
jgi:hypothetical protein